MGALGNVPPLMFLLLRIALGSALAGSAGWLAWYALRGGGHSALGKALIIDRVVIIALLGLSALSVYFGLSRLTSMTVAWIQIGLLASIGPVMVYLVYVVRRASQATRHCPNGHVISVLARFCPRCGAAIPEAAPSAD